MAREPGKSARTGRPRSVLVVGLGSIGRRHLMNLRALAPETEIVLLRHARGGSPEGEDLASRVVYSLDEALATRPEAAVIASPAPFHLMTALTLAREGVHLFVEKPLSDRLEGVDELLAACAISNRVLLPGYNLRYCRSLQIAQSAIASGRIGRVLSLRAEVGQYLPDWRPDCDYRQTSSAQRRLGGGVLLELSHELDYARWLAGEVTSIFAHTARTSELEIDVEDLAEITLAYESGAVGSIHLDMVSPAPMRSCRIIGSLGIIEWNGISGEVACYLRSERRWSELCSPASVDRNEMYLEEMRHFLACAAGEETARVTGFDGKRALELALAARESARRRRVVDASLRKWALAA
jgi:predicted dehydrogenase